jgi:hypothetical protein
MARPKIDADEEQFVEVDSFLFSTHLEKNFELPVIEDEDGNGVWGFGHVDKKKFAGIVNLYDLALTGGDEYGEPYTEDDVQHKLYYGVKRTDALEDDYLQWYPPEGEADLDDPLLFKMTTVSR